MGIKFSKMHGAGNDFVVMKHDQIRGMDYSTVAKRMCDRHFGIGADGVMVVEESKDLDIKMVYYNSDGSMGEMCGNGIRCFTKFVYDNHIVRKNKIEVETAAGKQVVHLNLDDNGDIELISVDMGKPIFEPRLIPVVSDSERILEEKIIIDDKSFIYSALLVGVPHLVIEQDDIDDEFLAYYGSRIETSDIFPNKTNVNFIKIQDRSHMIVETWERGAGRTLACGTGVCSSVFTAHSLGKVEDVVNVRVAGGELIISILEDSRIIMRGPAELICIGEFVL